MEDYPKIDYVMEREGLNKVCKYSTSKGQRDPENPHRHEVRDRTKLIKDDITDVIGNTPLVRINNITKKDGIKCELCKFLSSLNNSFSGKVRVLKSRWFSQR
jgi:cystathionine beta-synthase